MKVILTGHSRGLGAAMASALLERGMPLLGLARQSNSALLSAYPGLLTEVCLDLADELALRRWRAAPQLSDFRGGSDETLLVINHAGVLGPMAALDAQAPEEIAAAITINVTAPLLLSAVLAQRHAGELRILHLSSGAARNPYPGWSICGASNEALDPPAR